LLEITTHCRIPDSEFQWTFVRSGGPGGQNVNKVASKAVLRWDLAGSPSLPAEVKARLRARQHRRVTAEGVLILTSQRFRDQEQNRRDCLDKLRDLVRQAATPPRRRQATRPTRASRERRLHAKERRARTKSARRPPEAE
jgi:ribosome-associated protein